MKRPILLIIGLLFLSMLVMGLMFIFSEPDVSGHGGFTRNYIANPIHSADTIDLHYDSWYIAGQTGTTLFLGNVVAPLRVISIDLGTKDTSHFSITLDNHEKIGLGEVRLRVDASRIFLYDGTAPVIFGGDLAQKVVRRMPIRAPYFMEAEPMSDDRFAFRSILKNRVADLMYADTTESAVCGILTRQVDGLLCTAGMMSFDHQSNELVYVYFYRNEIIVMDSCMRYKRSFHTIDTITTAKISVASMSDKSRTVFSSPPLLVNRQSSVFNNVLVVNSKIPADNDERSKLSYGCDFDFYDIGSGKYQYSVYVAHLNDQEARFHRLVNNRLVVLYERQLIIYELAEEITCNQEISRTPEKKIVGKNF